MVALAVVVAVHLPVRADLVHEAMAVRERLDGLVGDRREERGVIVGQRRARRRRGSRTRTRAIPPTRTASSEHSRRVDVGSEVARRPQRSVERVRPAVIAGRRSSADGRGPSVTSGPARWRHTLWNARERAVRSAPRRRPTTRRTRDARSRRARAGARGSRRAATARPKTACRSRSYSAGSKYSVRGQRADHEIVDCGRAPVVRRDLALGTVERHGRALRRRPSTVTVAGLDDEAHLLVVVRERRSGRR